MEVQTEAKPFDIAVIRFEYILCKDQIPSLEKELKNAKCPGHRIELETEISRLKKRKLLAKDQLVLLEEELPKKGEYTH